MTPLDSERKDVGKKIVDAMGGVDGPKKVVAGAYSITRVDSSSAYTDKVGVASDLGVSIEKYDEVVAANKKKRPYSYPKVVKLGDK